MNQNLSEFYDELYPVTEEQKRFYSKMMEMYDKPVKLLNTGCGTGTFEHMLAREGSDVTGLETLPELLESANRKRRTQLMSIRYFQMSSLEMARFLGKKFYNIISIVHDRIIYTHDSTLMAKLFYDCKQLLTDNGKLIIGCPNFIKFKDQAEFSLPAKESIRSTMTTKVFERNGQSYLTASIENSSGRRYFVKEDAPIIKLQKEDIEKFVNGAGFSKVEFYGGFDFSPLTEDSTDLIAVVSA